MAKKVVATLKTGTGKNFTKVIKMVKSEKTGAYAFKSDIVPNDQIKDFFARKKEAERVLVMFLVHEKKAWLPKGKPRFLFCPATDTPRCSLPAGSGPTLYGRPPSADRCAGCCLPTHAPCSPTGRSPAGTKKREAVQPPARNCLADGRYCRVPPSAAFRFRRLR